MLLQRKDMCDSFFNLFAEKPRRFRLARSWAKKLLLGVIAPKNIDAKKIVQKTWSCDFGLIMLLYFVM